jgi:hypothetical protein
MSIERHGNRYEPQDNGVEPVRSKRGNKMYHGGHLSKFDAQLLREHRRLQHERVERAERLADEEADL